ncbi:hypothetical protein IQ255_25635 [Pleurocapsales cyanobacterium LEGE 10410]|nr:hypothetical protein [Pleurocapsales cyanobacterium LEGE 10410]
MNQLDNFFIKNQHTIRSVPLLYRFTLGTRILLAIGFIPTGMVKLLGYRFTLLSTETEVGAFFEVLYQSGLYWQFLGFSQVVAGLLLLVPYFSALGALVFTAIITNIVVITISIDFAYTPIVTIPMLLATLWLVIWDYDRFRSLFFNSTSLNSSHNNNNAPSYKSIPNPTLANSLERVIYGIGTVSGLILFSVLRGLELPAGSEYVLVGICLLCFVCAVFLGIRYRKE